MLRQMTWALLIVLSSFVFTASAGTIRYDGGGADNKWSTAANWDGDVVPGTGDDVVFDATSGNDCVIDANVEVASLKIDAAYTGTVSCGSSTITANTGDIDIGQTADVFDAGTGRLRFTGSGYQNIRYPNCVTVLYAVENAKTDSTLEFVYGNLTIHEFKALPGTITKFTNHTMRVNVLDLQGTDGNLVTVVSRYEGSQTNLSLKQSQTIAYTSFEKIDASWENGVPIDAGNNCVDAGNNLNINFNGVKFWDGGGADSKWSTAANWTGDAVPTTSQDVVFDGRTTKDCEIDANIEVAALKITTAYTGTVSCGAYTITANLGDIDVSENSSLFDAGTGTLQFTGSASQELIYPNGGTLYNVKNAKTGSALVFNYANITLNKLEAIAGTETQLTIHTIRVNALDLQGAAGNLAVLKSYYSGNQTSLSLKDSQSIAYVSFTDIDASWESGVPIDASFGCVNGGNNVNVNFDGVKFWDGGGADTNWSTAANWTGDTLPTAQEDVVFDSRTTKNCTIDADVSVHAFRILSSYTGTVSGGSATISISGDQLQLATGTSFSAGTSTVRFCGSGDQKLEALWGATVYNLTVDGSELFIRYTLNVNKFTATAGSTVRFLENNGLRVEEIDCQGTAAAPIRLSVSPLSGVWNLKHNGTAATQTLKYLIVEHCDGSTGTTLDGTDNCIDMGKNTNWTFSAVAGLNLPTSSAVSPVCVEGWQQGTITGPLTVSNGGPDQAVTTVGDKLWYCNTALSASGAVTVSVKDNGTVLASESVTWTSTNIVNTSSMDLRAGDSLLLTATGTGTTLTIDADGDGTVDYTGVPGDTFAYAYSTTGSYTATAKIDGTEVGTTTVNVIGIDFGTRTMIGPVEIAAPRSVTVTPAAGVGQVWLGSSNEAILYVEDVATTGAVREVSQIALDRDTNKCLVARVGSETGPIIGYQQLTCFNLTWTTGSSIPIMKRYADGDILVSFCLKMDPVVQDVRINVKAASGGALFENGSTSQVITNADFSTSGYYTYYMVTPTTGHSCHSLEVLEYE